MSETMAEEKRCDVDDIICQAGILSHLRGMKGLLGDDKFKTEFPEFEVLETTLSERIKSQKLVLRKSLEGCGLPTLEILGETASGSEDSLTALGPERTE